MSHVSCYIATFFSKLFPQILLHSRVTYFILTVQHNLTGTSLENGIQMLPSLKSPECFVKYSESWLWTIACRTLSRAGLTSRVQPYFQLLYFYLLVFSVVCWDYLCLYQAIRIQVKYLVSVITIRIVFRKQIASIVSLFFWKLHKRMYQYLWFSFVILWDQPFSAFTHKSQLSHSPLTYLQPVFNVSLASYILCSSS